MGPGRLSQNPAMPKRSNTKSMREAARHAAIDASGVQHTVVERVEMSTPLTYGVRSSGELTGMTSYYSMTTGDALTRLDDGAFVGRDGALRLRLVEEALPSGS